MKKAKSDTTHCEHLCLAGAVSPSFASWPTARLFSGRDPPNSLWTVCVLLCPQNLKNLKSFISYRTQFIYTGSEVISDCSHPRNCLFIPDTNYSHHIDSLWWPLTLESIRTGSEFIYTGSEILIPDPNLFISADNSEDFIRIRSSLLPNCVG